MYKRFLYMKNIPKTKEIEKKLYVYITTNMYVAN